jgi:hypothetical protein
MGECIANLTDLFRRERRILGRDLSRDSTRPFPEQRFIPGIAPRAEEESQIPAETGRIETPKVGEKTGFEDTTQSPVLPVLPDESTRHPPGADRERGA